MTVCFIHCIHCFFVYVFLRVFIPKSYLEDLLLIMVAAAAAAAAAAAIFIECSF